METIKTIKEKAKEYSLKEGNENADVKYTAYVTGALETLQSVLDHVKKRKQFEMIRMDEFAQVVRELNGTAQ